MYVKKDTLDDLLREVLADLLKSRKLIRPSRGEATETMAVLLEITNPRARLSLSETRGRFASCLGELLWYLAGTKDLKFISYYLSRYRKESDDGVSVYGGYGPRLFGKSKTQVSNVIEQLKSRDSRRAVIQLFDAADIVNDHKDVPCTCTLQFMLRSGRLYLFTNMRSNDAFLGLPHDVFAFTMLQEMIAKTLGVKLGTYKHAVGSLHLYRRDRDLARQYLNEGWQSTAPMPPMPDADPWSSIAVVIKAERAIRRGQKININGLSLPPYWEDLVRLLEVYRHYRQRQITEITRLKSEMSVRLFDSYIEDLRNRLRSKAVKTT